MIGVRLLSREEIQEFLEPFGCVLVEEMNEVPDPMYRASYWRTSWGFHFYIPEIGPDRMCIASVFYGILMELAEQAAKKGA